MQYLSSLLITKHTAIAPVGHGRLRASVRSGFMCSAVVDVAAMRSRQGSLCIADALDDLGPEGILMSDYRFAPQYPGSVDWLLPDR